MIFLKIIGIIVLIFIIFCMIIMCVGIKYKIKLIYKEYGINYFIKVNIFFNIVHVIVKGMDKNLKVFIKILFIKKELKINSKQSEYRTMQDTEGDKHFNIVSKVEMFYNNREYILKFISRIKPKFIKVEGTYGFKDPYITGMLSGFVGSVAFFLPPGFLELNPDFFNEIFNLKMKAKGKIRIIFLIAFIVRFVVSNLYRNVVTKLRFRRKSKTRGNRLENSDEMKFN